MKNLITLILCCVLFSGCSMIPRLTTDTKNTLPQSINKSKIKESCKGKAEWNEDGTIKSCSKGYVNYEEAYNKQERKYSLWEKFINFQRKLAGYGIILFILAVIFIPGTLGFFVGKLFEGAFGIASQAGKRIMQAVQKARKQGKDLNDALEAELDEVHKKYIAKVKEQENIK